MPWDSRLAGIIPQEWKPPRGCHKSNHLFSQQTGENRRWSARSTPINSNNYGKSLVSPGKLSTFLVDLLVLCWLGGYPQPLSFLPSGCHQRLIEGHHFRTSTGGFVPTIPWPMDSWGIKTLEGVGEMKMAVKHGSQVLVIQVTSDTYLIWKMNGFTAFHCIPPGFLGLLLRNLRRTLHEKALIAALLRNGPSGRFSMATESLLLNDGSIRAV